jgi:uncharacterized membrane protein YeaQ/YmgE (transglycosylase-associated protein family)
MKYRNVIAVLLGVWFTIAVSAAAMGMFKNVSDSLALPVAAAALAPMVVFLSWFTASAGLRQYLYGLNPRTLTIAQSWRVNGVVFLVLSAYGLLPALFALPAGLGDMAIGITAPWIASRFANREHKSGFILWQILGIVDLVTAVTLGTTARLIDQSGPGMGPMTVLPLSLVPTFIVPLLLMIHVVSIAQARRWQGRSYPHLGAAAPSAAR